jgi:hypothetical protein
LAAPGAQSREGEPAALYPGPGNPAQTHYSSTGLLVHPAGTKLKGTVNEVKAADWMKNNGGLLFSFHSSQNADGTTSDVKGTVAGVEAAGGKDLPWDRKTT